MAFECRNYAIWDSETWDTDTNKLEMVDLACVILNGETLEPMEGGEFQSYMKPKDWNNFNPKAIEVNKLTVEFIREHGKDRKDVLLAFGSFLNQFKVKGIPFGGAPISCGKRQIRFDEPALNRICREEGLADKNGENKFFDKTIRIDLEEEMYRWFQGRPGPRPAKANMDELRNFFKMSHEGSHGALVDAKQTGILIRKFLKLYRRHDVKFQGACEGETW